MDNALLMVLVITFVAVVFALEGAYLLWNDRRGPEVQRLERRVRMVSAGRHGQGAVKLLKRKHGGDLPWLDRQLLRLPRISQLDRVIEQAGMGFGLGRLMAITAGLVLAVSLIAVVLRLALIPTLLCSGLAAVLPMIWLLWKRGQRMTLIEQQLPDAIDLIARAMRAGHA